MRGGVAEDSGAGKRSRKSRLLRPRKVAPAAIASGLGGGVAVVDVSWVIALALLALVAAEVVVRALTRPRAEVA